MRFPFIKTLSKSIYLISVLKARYGEEGGQLKDGGRTSSVWWRGMVGIHDGIGIGVGNWFDENISKIVGDGRSTFFRMDNWIGEVPLCVRFSRLFDLAKNQTCSVAEMQQFGWSLDLSNGYSVSGVYQMFTTPDPLVVRANLDTIWHEHVPLKVSLFVWRLFFVTTSQQRIISCGGELSNVRPPFVPVGVRFRSLRIISSSLAATTVSFGLLFKIG
ncbi:hypothetical protein MTR_4g052370 [Medicago truncatula]|uniref:Reverse transcriptase zinc-binding domain-containing protein n=1 Tax=Medicago truncatula TaxID=3880 RepID=A0A072UJ92_MEDTR|nr:hypothetical protein MTR_4g052370 [Medicago truncatula]